MAAKWAASFLSSLSCHSLIQRPHYKRSEFAGIHHRNLSLITVKAGSASQPASQPAIEHLPRSSNVARARARQRRYINQV
uniref:Putative secreted protein n=1 Tax=Anopheles darlingi TaxID=43151 RepID=A0A2M4DL06_ANODA